MCPDRHRRRILAQPNLVLMWFCRCWAAPPPAENRTAQHLASVRQEGYSYPAASGEPDAIDTDEVVTAIAMTVAELTCGQDGTIRQQLIEQLMREIIDYDAEFRRDA